MKKLLILMTVCALFIGCQKKDGKAEQDGDRQKSALSSSEQTASPSTPQPGKEEGDMFTDFSCEYNGKTQRLSDYVGHGRYVLVDFWASWCGPCREEIPNMIAVYNKYHAQGLDVVGVATWDEPENTLQAIQEDHIPYPQILNAQEAGSNAYGIQGIPEIILFGPDGTILKRGLRGPEIESTVKQHLAAK